jgi:LacI family transcriptional regulator
MEWYSFLDYPLTTIDQSPYQMGKTAGEMLLQRIRGKRKNPKRVVSPSRLIVRGSTAKVNREGGERGSRG